MAFLDVEPNTYFQLVNYSADSYDDMTSNVVHAANAYVVLLTNSRIYYITNNLIIVDTGITAIFNVSNPSTGVNKLANIIAYQTVSSTSTISQGTTATVINKTFLEDSVLGSMIVSGTGDGNVLMFLNGGTQIASTSINKDQPSTSVILDIKVNSNDILTVTVDCLALDASVYNVSVTFL